MQKMTPFLWFDAQAEEAVAFYVSVFKDGKIQTTTRYPEDGPRPAGTVMTIAWRAEFAASSCLSHAARVGRSGADVALRESRRECELSPVRRSRR